MPFRGKTVAQEKICSEKSGRMQEWWWRSPEKNVIFKCAWLQLIFHWVQNVPMYLLINCDFFYLCLNFKMSRFYVPLYIISGILRPIAVFIFFGAKRKTHNLSFCDVIPASRWHRRHKAVYLRHSVRLFMFFEIVNIVPVFVTDCWQKHGIMKYG